MAAPTTTTSTEHGIATTGRERLSAGEKIWVETDRIFAARYTEARAQMQLNTPSSDILRLAYANQAAFLQSFENEELEELTTQEITAERLVMLLFEAPAFMNAQRDLDTTSNGQLTHTERHQRVLVASQFNRDLSSILTYMPRTMIPTFSEQFLQRYNHMAATGRLYTIAPERFGNFIEGMSREVAFNRGLRYNIPDDGSWVIEETTLEDDFRGQDARVLVGDTLVAIDIKSDDGFLRKLNKLNVSQYDRDFADEHGYLRDNDHFIVNADHIGRIKDCEYVVEAGAGEHPVIAIVQELARAQRHINLLNMGKSAIVSGA